MTVRADDTRYLERPGGGRLAYCLTAGRAPTVVYLCGMTTPMSDPKALHIEALCRDRGNACLRFDYQGRSGSSGDYDEGTLTRRLDDTLSVVDALTEGPLVLVGYSMGGCLMLLAALAIPDRIAGLAGIAPGVDFADCLEAALTPEERTTLERDGRIVRTSPEYPDEPWVVTRALIEDAKRHRLLDASIAIDCPVRLLHGTADPDAPWEGSVRVAERLSSADVEVTLLKGWGHRLQDEASLRRVGALVEELLDRLG